MTVYLLHFLTPYKHAKHYLGSTSDLEIRLAQHRSGHGARLVEVITQAGIDFTLARTWAGGRDIERQLREAPRAKRAGKRQKNSPRLCPICHSQQGE
jgi:predicted GIY-YIG superfamily endonuclease